MALVASLNYQSKKLPFANPVTISRQCDDDQDGFSISIPLI
jgi:hypothetical protein